MRESTQIPLTVLTGYLGALPHPALRLASRHATVQSMAGDPSVLSEWWGGGTL